MSEIKLADRLLSKVQYDANSGCWLFDGGWNNREYGMFHVPGKGMCLAHRVSFRLFVGSLPDNVDVLHRCDVTCCVRPDHLFRGDSVSNSNDMTNKFRGGAQIITREQALEIRRDYIPGTGRRKGNVDELAEKYGLKPATVQMTAKGHNWKHL